MASLAQNVPVKMTASLIIAIKIQQSYNYSCLMSERQQSKTGNLIFFGFGAIALAWSFFKNRRNPKSDIPQEQYVNEMIELRVLFLQKKPTHEQSKNIFLLVTLYTMSKLTAHNVAMKKKCNSASDLRNYLQILIAGVEQGKTISKQAKHNAYCMMGIEPETFLQYYQDNSKLKEQIRNQYFQEKTKNNISLSQTKELLQLQIGFFKAEGESFAKQIIQNTFDWSKQKRQYLRIVMPLMILDKVCEGLPKFQSLDESEFESAKSTFLEILGKFRKQIGEQIRVLHVESQKFTNIIQNYLSL